MIASYHFQPSPDRLTDVTKAPLASPVFSGIVTVPGGAPATPGLVLGAGAGLFSTNMGVLGLSLAGREAARVTLSGTTAEFGLNTYPSCILHAVDPVRGSSFAWKGYSLVITDPLTSGATLIDATKQDTSTGRAVAHLKGGGGAVTALWAASSGDVALSGPMGGEALRTVPVGGAVNRVEVKAGLAGAGPLVAAAGADANVTLRLSGKGSGGVQVGASGGALGFYGCTPAARPTVTGSRSGDALANLLAQLAALGLIVDSTTA